MHPYNDVSIALYLWYLYPAIIVNISALFKMCYSFWVGNMAFAAFMHSSLLLQSTSCIVLSKIFSSVRIWYGISIWLHRIEFTIFEPTTLVHPGSWLNCPSKTLLLMRFSSIISFSQLTASGQSFFFQVFHYFFIGNVIPCFH